MIVSLLRDGGLLLLQAAHTDTVIMRRAMQDTSWPQQTAAILSALMSLGILALAAAIIPAARNFRKSYAKVDLLLGRLNEEILPVLKKAGTVVENMEYITTSVRGDIDLVKSSIELAHEKLVQAVALTEQRLNDFNALLEVAQDEAEAVFVATASTARGVRTGVASLHHEDDEEDAEDAPLPTSEELDDGYDDSDRQQAGTSRPRVRKRSRGWA
ncbi:MAG: hypothetical protein JWM95_2831 [Gemmatimonadetes bacterium]|nr:hypothetical protein [Gemmatimonadota bacterium]